MNFSDALIYLKAGERMTRGGWNGKDMWATLQQGYPHGVPINSNTAKATGMAEGTVCRFRPYLMLKAVDDSFVPWIPSVSDILAEDWEVVR